MNINFRKISIRYKLLFLLVTLPVITLALYLLLATRLFKSDKVAYIFDSSTNATQNSASQVRLKLESIQSRVRSLAQGFDSFGKKFDESSIRILQNDDALLQITVYRKSSSEELEKLAQLNSPTQLLSVNTTSAQEKMARDLSGTNIELARVEKSEELLMLASSSPLSGPQSTANLIFVTTFRAEDLIRSFQTSGLYLSFLVTPTGNLILGPKEAVQDVLGSATSFQSWKMIEDIKKKKLSVGASEGEAPSGQDFLISYSQTGIGNFLVLSFVKQSVALRAIQILIAKSALFFVSLVSGAILVSVFASGKLTSTLRELHQGTEQIAKGDFNIHLKVQSEDEVGNLAQNFNKMAAEVSRLLLDSIKKAGLEKELETAKAVQETLFPQPVSQLGPLKIVGFYEPAGQCGGDWWHYCEIQKKIFLWIGDATGHGVPAALITSAAKSAATIMEHHANITPAHALNHLNRAIYSTSKGKIMMTFFVACFDPATGELSYACASHDPPFLLKRSSEPITKHDLIPLNDVNNSRLGEHASHKYQETKIQLHPGDSVVFYTDGVLDVTDKQGKAWGEKNFLKSLTQSYVEKESLDQFVGKMKADLEDYRAGTELIDDVTFFSCRYEST